MSFRHSFTAISTPWLSRYVGKRIVYSIGTALDAYTDAIREGIKVRFPGAGTFEALPFLGRDRQIERGPRMTSETYADRLSNAFDTWLTAGAAKRVVLQVGDFFSPDDPPLIRAVSNRGLWHQLDAGVVTRIVPTDRNWGWDAAGQSTPPTENKRGWLIISGSEWWEVLHWGDGHHWGLGTWGSTMTRGDVDAIRAIVKRWKGAHNFVPAIIVTFDDDLFLPENDPADNPTAPDDWNLSGPRVGVSAIFLSAVRTQGD